MKKINAGYEVNHLEGKIILTKGFIKAAGTLDSPEYTIMKQLRLDNPTYTLEQREIRRKDGKESYRNLNYKNMRAYITALEGADSGSLAELDKVIQLSKIQAGPYAYVKTWFLKKFPAYKDQEACKIEETETTVHLVG